MMIHSSEFFIFHMLDGIMKTLPIVYKEMAKKNTHKTK